MRIILGTAQFGMDYGIANRKGKLELREVERIIRLAEYNGLDTLDTASAYGDGEKRLGEVDVSNWQVISKLPRVKAHSANISNWIRAVVTKSLRNLRIENLYAILLHCSEDLSGHSGQVIYSTINDLKEQGLIKKFGISVYNPSEIARVLEKFDVDIVQAPFNIFDRRLIDTNWLSRLYDSSIEFHARSVFLQGLLLMPPLSRPQKFNKWKNLWSQWDHWLGANSMTPMEASIQYVLGFPEVSKMIVGVDSRAQLSEILEAQSGTGISLPENLKSNDLDLINPHRWDHL